LAKKSNYEKNGVKYFRATHSLGRDVSGKRVIKEFYGKTKKEAEQKKEEYKKSIEMGLSMNYDKISFGELMHEWIYTVMLNSNLATSTKERYEGIYRNYISKSALFYQKLKLINSKTIQDYFNTLHSSGKSESIIKNIHKLLKIFFGYAVDENYIIKNPAKSKHISIIDEKKVKNVIEVFSDEEIKLMLTALKKHYLEPIVLLALGSGLRRGEILGLKWADIDFEKNMLNVERTLRTNKHISEDGSYYYLLETQSPKSKTSIRTVSLPDAITEILLTHREAQRKMVQRGMFEETEFVFVSTKGKLLDGRNLLRAFKRFLRSIDIPSRSFHTLRHTYATKLFEKNVPLKTVQVLLGHSDISITANIYTHVMPVKLQEAVSELNEYFTNKD
jgi:integrase